MTFTEKITMFPSFNAEDKLGVLLRERNTYILDTTDIDLLSQKMKDKEFILKINNAAHYSFYQMYFLNGLKKQMTMSVKEFVARSLFQDNVTDRDNSDKKNQKDWAI